MGLEDQLKKHKLLGKTGVALSLPTARRTCCSCKRCSSRPTKTQTTSRTAKPPASTAAAFDAAQLSEDGSAG
eukprot:778957-Pleurochrysis_carterae.AAC.1